MPNPPDLTGLPPGTMLAGPPWDKPVRLLSAERRDGVTFLHLDGMGTKMYGPGQLDGVSVVEPAYGKPWKAHAYVSILRHERARNLGIAGNADPLPHQLESIYHITGIPGPIRFLLADEPGAGKTAVASRIIQELILQRRIANVLLVVPAQLKTQWKSELSRFAGISGHIVEGQVSGNPWITDRDVLITSMDLAKSERHLNMLGQAEFDLVVVDEAHNLNATAKKSTDRYKLGETLSNISKHMIFLTATPHRGKTENFRLLLKLLEPVEFSDPNMGDGEISSKKRRLFLRHIKEEMKGMDDEVLFMGRSVISLAYDMSDAERRMYKAVTSYVSRQFAASEMSANKAAGFAILLIQKRMASSTHSLLKTLQRRRVKIVERRDSQTEYDLDDVYDLTDSEKMAREEDLEGVTMSRTDDEVRAELDELDRLIEAATIAAETKPDTKLESLLDELRGLGDDQLLVFSEYRDTLDYLEENIRKNGLGGNGICRIDGTMDMRVRQQAQDDFNSGRKKIMLATDAAREGINLQYRCHRMVNYDLPWSPIALEQRMGRLHRYGQKRDVVIHNLVASKMMEGDVLKRLFDKLEEIGKQYRTFDVMGTVLTGINMGAMLEEVVRRGGSVDVEGSVEKAAERARSADQMLARTPVDIEFVRSRMRKIERQKTDGHYLVDAVGRLLSKMGGSVRSSRDGNGTVLHVPERLVGGPLGRRRVPLPGPPAEALARVGAAYRHIADWVLDNCSDDLGNGSVFVDDTGRDGWVVFHEVAVTDGRSNEAARLLLAHFTDGTNVTEVEPHILDGMSYGETDPDSGPGDGDLVGHVFRAAQGEVDEMTAGRKAFWKTRSEVGRNGLERQISEIEVRQSGMSVMEPKHDQLSDELLRLKNRLKALNGEAERETRLSLDEPRMLGWVRVVPAGRIKTDTEMLGMKASTDHERREGFEVEDVHDKRGLGYDLVSRHPDGRVRKIEVKARCDMGSVEFTDAEKRHLETDPDAVLHILRNAGSDDEWLDIRDDPSKLGFTAARHWRMNESTPD